MPVSSLSFLSKLTPLHQEDNITDTRIHHRKVIVPRREQDDHFCSQRRSNQLISRLRYDCSNSPCFSFYLDFGRSLQGQDRLGKRLGGRHGGRLRQEICGSRPHKWRKRRKLPCCGRFLLRLPLIDTVIWSPF